MKRHMPIQNIPIRSDLGKLRRAILEQRPTVDYSTLERSVVCPPHQGSPCVKSPAISNLLDALANRTEASATGRCVNPPMGCGGPAVEFRNDISRKEYTMTAWCQACQDKFYGVD